MAYDADVSNRLAAVRTAIAACLTSQAYGVGQRRQQMADLRDLRQLEKELQWEADRESSPLASVVTIDSPGTVS
jgi:hypothetical protein